MCGIFGYVGKEDNVGEMILKGLKTLEYRGYDSWGIAVKVPATIVPQSRLSLSVELRKVCCSHLLHVILFTDCFTFHSESGSDQRRLCTGCEYRAGNPVAGAVLG